MPSVPSDAVRYQPDNRWRRIHTVVVLPFVPVTPARIRSSCGSPCSAAAATAAARRPSRTTIYGNVTDSTLCSTSAAAAPAAWTTARYAYQSGLLPLHEQQRSPLLTYRLSSLMPRIVSLASGARTSRPAPSSRAAPILNDVGVTLIDA